MLPGQDLGKQWVELINVHIAIQCDTRTFQLLMLFLQAEILIIIGAIIVRN